MQTVPGLPEHPTLLLQISFVVLSIVVGPFIYAYELWRKMRDVLDPVGAANRRAALDAEMAKVVRVIEEWTPARPEPGSLGVRSSRAINPVRRGMVVEQHVSVYDAEPSDVAHSW